MAKRKRNSTPEPEVPASIVVVFFVIALVVAIAKVGVSSTHSVAANPPQIHVA